MKNITYLFGAGASYNACPIWKEQSEKMIELPKFLSKDFTYRENEYITLSSEDKIIWLIGYIGKKASEFNTVDTYAKKLFLLNKRDELERLKLAVSCFFTLWELSNETSWKQRKLENDKLFYFRDVDHRYINLLATYLERKESFPQLKKNIKFVTWNYDLQLESAFSKFIDTNKKDAYIEVNKHFRFIPERQQELEVCHLNGFQGFYGNGNGENLFDRSNNYEIASIIKSIDFIMDSSRRGNLSFQNYINYAWDTSSEISEYARKTAKRIYSQTEILVIVGYSFPPFNHEIDRLLFQNANKLERVIIQDPRGDAKFLSETFGVDTGIITVVNNTDQFVIPNYAEEPTVELSDFID